MGEVPVAVSHLLQLVPIALLYVPRLQGWNGPPAFPSKPGIERQLFFASEPCARVVEWTGHSAQLVAPTFSEYVPFLHGSTLPFFDEVYAPLSLMHLSMELAFFDSVVENRGHFSKRAAPAGSEENGQKGRRKHWNSDKGQTQVLELFEIFERF